VEAEPQLAAPLRLQAEGAQSGQENESENFIEEDLKSGIVRALLSLSVVCL
jgi:hypothetical protein